MNTELQANIIIKGEIELLTGMHIGSGGQFGIGLIDSPVIRDPLTKMPYIPGSSLKGRLRHGITALTKSKDTNNDKANAIMGESPNKNNKRGSRTRLYVRDAHLTESNDPKLEKIKFSEVKYENSVNYQSGKAQNPRQIERVPKGTKFKFELMYKQFVNVDAKHDLQLIYAAIRNLEDEYIGASGSRGYGKVKFHLGEEACQIRDLNYYNNAIDQQDNGEWFSFNGLLNLV